MLWPLLILGCVVLVTSRPSSSTADQILDDVTWRELPAMLRPQSSQWFSLYNNPESPGPGHSEIEEQRLRVFENKVLRKTFGAERDEVTEDWRKLHNAELQELYSSPDIIRNIKSGRLRWAGHVAHMSESRNAYRVLVGRPEVFENKVLRKIFGAKRDEVTGEWRKLHNTELHALYSSPDIIRNIKSRRLRWAGHVARMGESRNAYRVLVGRPEGKRPLGRPRRRWEDNIKMDLREVGYDNRDWINLAQDRDRWRAYVRAAMNLRSKEASRSSTRVCVRICVSIRRPEFECSGPQLEGPEFECSGPQLEGPEFEYSELSLKVCGSRYRELELNEPLDNLKTSLQAILQLIGRTTDENGQTGRSFQTRYKEHITAITKLQNTSTYAEHITNANHIYKDINTDMKILHIQPKSQKLNTLEQYEICRHTKTHPNDILNTQLNFKTHTLFDSTLRTRPHRKQERQHQQRLVPKMTENRSKYVNKWYLKFYPPGNSSTGIKLGTGCCAQRQGGNHQSTDNNDISQGYVRWGSSNRCQQP
ncbi:hypothetical protein ANN_05827 [Periplaneta americana]|uniref:Uncharacterized protein n=1 Tax=Periplaneta americana TaxID=6978 RepID=A0ABQ8TCS3_PERAM|nr:hypothetical protein ANN_05827 [Periplaneta americana]